VRQWAAVRPSAPEQPALNPETAGGRYWCPQGPRLSRGRDPSHARGSVHEVQLTGTQAGVAGGTLTKALGT
jgi:hypothetical protein